MSRRITRCASWSRAAFALTLALLGWSFAASAQADAISLTDLTGGVNVSTHAQWLRDPTRALSMEQVSSPALAGSFLPLDRELILGFDAAALWLRFDALNDSDEEKPWLLELAYPHLDFVTLYVQHEDGLLERRETGDMRDFSQRDLPHPNFAFALENAPRERTTYYLRVATTGTVRLPLSAWNELEYSERQTRINAVSWLFVGALLIMALFNVAVFGLIRQVEFLTQAGLLVALCAVLTTFNGLTFQYLLPHAPLLANRAIGLSLTMTMAMGTLTCAQVTARAQRTATTNHLVPFVRAFRAAAALAFALCFVAFVAPKELATRVSVVGPLLYVVGGLSVLFNGEWRKHPQLRLFSLSWCCVLLLAPISLLANQGLMPAWPVLTWAAHIGCALQGVFTSLALAARVKTMSDHVAGLNQQLSSNVESLQHALARAEEANEAAQRATRAKDEFLATMSHELRTPLNAIINVPQGLLDDFVDRRTARCRVCSGNFVLEPGDQLSDLIACMDCHTLGSLVEGVGVTYVGDPNQTARFLRKIERSGQHLLQLVDGVLDFSKLEAGRFELSWGELDLTALVRDVVDVMSEPAQRKGLAIALEAATGAPPRRGDALRLKQVLLNLLSNAIKFSEPGGTIGIRCTRDGETDLVAIRDQGIGIAPEHHERIFSGFEQVHKGDKRKYGGTGLGLSISRALVRMHGGELWVESALGQGAVFVFRLPAGEAVSVPQAG